MRILVVEDDPSTKIVINGILVKNGHEAVISPSVNDAIRRIQNENSIDLVICDIMMPELDGFELLKFVMKSPVYRKIPVLMCSAMMDKETVLKSIKLGARDFITKPVDSKIMMDKIRKATHRKDIPAVMVVDDEEFILEIVRKILERDGYRVLTYTSAREALKSLETENVKIVISDICMPEMDGMELLARVKSEHPDIKMLMITGHTGKYGEDLVVDAGADGYITKPFKNLEITRTLQRFDMERVRV